MQPDPVPFDEPGTVIVNFSSLPTFDSVILEIPGAEAQMPITVPRSAGQIQGTEWAYTTDLYNLTASYGQFTLIARLADGSTVSDPCSTTFELQD